MKAINSSLTGEQIARILVETAWSDSTDTSVKRYLNALAAVRAAGGQQLPEDDHEPNDMVARPIVGGANFERRTIHGARDRDVYRLTLDDYSTVDMKLTHTQGIGRLQYTITASNALGEPEGLRRTSRLNELGYHAEILPPGDWLITLSAATATMYRIELKTTGNALQPDRFEPNNTTPPAALPGVGLGEYSATIHRIDDVDWYEFDIPEKSPNTLGFSFNVRETDRPVTVAIYDAAGTNLETKTVPGGAIATLMVPQGRHRVKVTATAPHSLHLQLHADDRSQNLQVRG